MSRGGPAPEFVVVGDIMTDVVARVAGPLRHGTDTAAQVSTHGGGAGANTAAWLASEGYATVFVGRVGDDALGRASLDDLSASGVLTRVTVDPLERTGTCMVVVSSDGERTMLPDAGANDRLAPADLPDGDFAAGRHLHLSGYTLLHDGSRLAGLAALDLARRRRMTSSVDVASAGPLGDVGTDRFLSWVHGVDVCLANEDEACALAGVDDALDAGRRLAGLFAVVVVKRGAEGAVLLTGGAEPVTAPAVAVDVLDTTGAGDAFAAGFLPAWRDGLGARLSLVAGNTVASRAVSRVGARP